MLKSLTKKFIMHSLNDVNLPNETGSIMSTSDEMHTVIDDAGSPSPLPTSTTLTPSTSPSQHSPESSSSPPTSDSDGENENEEEEKEVEQTQHDKVQTLHCSTVLAEDLKVQRVSSAEKRKYSQYKCHTGSSNSSASSSDDDEVREVFASHTHHGSWPYPTPTLQSWRSKVNPHRPHWVKSSSSSSSSSSSGSSHGGTCCGRPLKVLPHGHRKPKFFAQMSESFGPERPCLDFNKMHHSKRLIMVRRPLVIRRNSKVHSIQTFPSTASSRS